MKYSNAVVLYQSRYFEELFPEENKHFANVEYVEAVEGDREASLLAMRRAMLSRPDLEAAVFIEVAWKEYWLSTPCSEAPPLANSFGSTFPWRCIAATST